METHHWKLKESTMSIGPRGFNATIELEAVITNTGKIEEWSNKKELWTYPVPDLGFSIKHLCTVGLTLQYQIGYSTKVLGSATLVLGATSSLPDNAFIFIDLLNHDKISHSGFEGHVLQPIFDVKALSASVKFAVFSQADMVFDIELHHLEKKYGVELNLKIPQLSTTANAGYSKNFSSPF